MTVAGPPSLPPPAVGPPPDVDARLATLGELAPMRRDVSIAGDDRMLAQARAGFEAYQRGDVRGAEALLSSAAREPAAPPLVHYTLGWSQFALSDHAAAASSWEVVRAAVPQFRAVYFDLADAYLRQQDLGKAIEVLREAEKRWPDDVEVHNAIGVVQTARHALNEAVRTFEKAVSVKPNDPTANYNLARVCELRYVQSQRLRDVSGSASGVFEKDRDCALRHYRRTVELGSLFVEEAKDGMRRLSVVIGR